MSLPPCLLCYSIRSVPHNILYATGLPPEITQVMLFKLFEQYPGFSEVRFKSLSRTYMRCISRYYIALRYARRRPFARPELYK